MSLSVYDEFQLVFGTITFAILYTASYNAMNETMDIAKILFTTAIFALIFWLSMFGASFFTFNQTQSLDTDTPNAIVQPLP